MNLLLQQSKAVCLCHCAASLVLHSRMKRGGSQQSEKAAAEPGGLVVGHLLPARMKLNKAFCHPPLQLEPWKLEPGDHTLLDLLPFLEAIYSTHRGDVRTVLKTYEGQDIPSAFR